MSPDAETGGPAGDPTAPVADATGAPAANATAADAQPPRRRRLLFLAVVAVLALISAGSFSAYLLLRDTGEGAAETADAARAFLEAAYVDQDPAATAAAVCPDARDEEAIAAKVRQIKEYVDQHAEPRFEWLEPRVTDQSADRATVAVTLTAITRDEKSAEQELTLTVVRTDGWWVCDVA